MKKIVVFLLGIVMLGSFIYPGVVFAEISSDENVTDQEITLDDVDFPVDGDFGHSIQPRGRGECYLDERLGRVPKGYCSSRRITVTTTEAQRKCLVNMFGYGALSSLSGNVLTLTGTLALTWWNNCRFK